jgi:hypothetical protein
MNHFLGIIVMKVFNRYESVRFFLLFYENGLELINYSINTRKKPPGLFPGGFCCYFE